MTTATDTRDKTQGEPPPASEPITRRRLLRGGLAAGGALAVGGGAFGVSRLLGGGHPPFLSSWRVTAGASGARHFRSRPDLLPATTGVSGRGATSGHLFVGPAAVGGSQAGALITDQSGEPIWFAPVSKGRWLTNFTAQTYRSAPVLTWWEGTVADGYGHGEGVIADASYRIIARVRAANGRQMDLHEFQLTNRGTALITCAPQTVATDLSSIGGPASAHVLESIFQEVDVASGRLVSEWRSLDHVSVQESYRSPSSTFDYLHLNSIDVTPDGQLLVSARHTWTVYKLDRASGEVIWRMGGKRTQFHMSAGTQYAWQHDARQVDDRTFTIFDDGNDGVTRTHSESRGELLDVDSRARTVRLVRAYTRPSGVSSTAMGSTRRLPGGHVLVGWGAAPYVTEFDAAGDVATDLRMPKTQKSYRAYRAPWTGRPDGAPAVAVARERSSGATTLYVSWNGATEVMRWRIDAGARASELRPLGSVPRRGFETAIYLGTSQGHVAATALDARGRVLGHSRTIPA